MVFVFGGWIVRSRGRKREKGEIGKAILASSVIAMVMITTLNVLTGREDLINALEIAIRAIPFVVLWTFLLISFFERTFCLMKTGSIKTISLPLRGRRILRSPLKGGEI